MAILQKTNENVEICSCPRCDEEFTCIAPNSRYVVIDEIKYLTPNAVCDLLESVSRERDELTAELNSFKTVCTSLTRENDRLSKEWQEVHDWNNEFVKEHYELKERLKGIIEQLKELKEHHKRVSGSMTFGVGSHFWQGKAEGVKDCINLIEKTNNTEGGHLGNDSPPIKGSISKQHV